MKAAEAIDKPGYFDLRGLAAYSSISVSMLRYYVREHGLPCFKLMGEKGNAGKVLVKRSEFDRWIESFRFNREQQIDDIVSGVMNSLKRA